MAEANAGGGGPPDFQSQLGEFKGNPALSSFQDVGALAKGYVNLSGKLGSRSMADMDPPSDETGRRTVLDKLGLAPPARPDDYDLPASAALFRTWAHKQGLTKAQAKGLFDAMVENGKKSGEQAKEQLTTRAKDAETALRGRWGEKYDTELETFKKGLDWLLPKEAQDAFNVSMARHNPAVIENIHAIGLQLREGRLVSAGNAAGGGPGDIAGAQAVLNKFVNDNRALVFSQNGLDPAVKDAKAKYTELNASLAKLTAAARSGAQGG
jgi:polyhydroxyalkanoate synthesis regulator phasin